MPRKTEGWAAGKPSDALQSTPPFSLLKGNGR